MSDPSLILNQRSLNAQAPMRCHRDSRIQRLSASGIRRVCWLGFSILIILGQVTTASAQLQATQEVDPTLEQSVDKAFGSVVGAMASVLFWDVIFWDNAHPPIVQAQIPSATPLSDPLGWGLITAQPEGLKQFDFHGQLQNTYAQPDLKVNEAWIINQGRKVLVKSSLSQAFIYTRTPAGQKTGEPIGPLELPEGSWSSFTELEGELLFGSSTGQVYSLIVNPNDQSTEWKAKNWKLDQASQLITRRADGRYWLAVDQFGAGVVIERVKPKVKGQPVTDQEVMRFTPAQDWGGIPMAAGFDHRQIWIASNTSLSAWSAQDGEHAFVRSYSGLNSVTPLKVTLPSAQDQGAYLLTSKSAPAQVITSKGAMIKISELISQAENSDHPLMNQVNSATLLGSTLWVNTAKGAYQIATRGPQQFKVEAHLAADQNLTEISQIGVMMITKSAQSGLQIWRSDNLKVPLIVLWLVFGALFFTLRMRFVNLRLFRHAIDVVRGKYTNPNSVGEVSHFQALTSALSATVGLGNIAGVAIAVGIGGPGATFWMIVAGFLGMASKFTECTLGQKYRTVSESGEVMGGAMHYLSRGLKLERGLPKVGQILAILFCILCVGASFGGGNAFQVKQSLEAVAEVVPFLADSQWVYGVVMAVAVGIVILGGIKSIAQTAEKIVPLMCGVYLLAALYVILAKASEVPHAFGLIFSGAFSPDALYGGAVGVLVVGFKRAAFSNEAGIGSAAIAHAAAKTEYPVREGVVALLEPFIDTIVVCTMTALVIVITGAYQNPEYGALIANNKGAALTSQAMGEVISFFPYVLSVAVVLFAYSTMISWSYYGERCWSWLFGEDGALFSMGKSASLIYKMMFLVFAFLGSIVTATNILDFSDLMILGMALPNIFGLLLLTRGVRKDLDSYEEKLRAGAFPIYDDHSEHPAQDDSSGES